VIDFEVCPSLFIAEEELGKPCAGAGGSVLCNSGSCDEEQGFFALCTAAKPFLNTYISIIINDINNFARAR
jgi:hypothetical protein